MSVEDTKDSVDSYEGHDEQGHSNVSVVEEGNITETNLFQWNLFSIPVVMLNGELTYKDANQDKNSHSHCWNTEISMK